MNSVAKGMRGVKLALGVVSVGAVVAACSSEGGGSARDARTEPTVGVGDSASAPPVVVAWETGADSAVEVRGTLVASIESHRAASQRVDVYAVALGVRDAIAVRVASIDLAASETRALRVSLDELPVQSTNAPTAIMLLANVVEEGVAKQIASDTLHAIFAPDYARAFVSTRDASGPLAMAGARARTGAPSGRLRDRSGAFADLAATTAPSEAAVEVAGLVGVGAPRPAPVMTTDGLVIGGDINRVIPPLVQICATYNVSFTDAHFGEDYLADGRYIFTLGGGSIWIPSAIPARFAQIWVRPQGMLSGGYTVQLDGNGCTSMRLRSGAWDATVSTHLSNGSTTYEVLKTWQKQVDQSCTDTTVGGALMCEGNDYFMSTFSVPTGVTSYSASLASGGATPAFRVAAVAGQLLSMSDSGLKPELYKVYSNSGCPSVAGATWAEACAAGGVAYYGLSIGVNHKDTTTEKFVIAHEMGHQLEYHALGSNFAINYPGSWPPSVPEVCTCDFVVSANKLHCLQSQHDFSTAHTEGFAHFVSQRTFNRTDQSDCMFVYYKEVLTQRVVITQTGPIVLNNVHSPPYPVDCASPPKRLETYCPAAGDGTEWDILEFLRAANSGTDALTMGEIIGVYSVAHSQVFGLTWPALQAAALSYFGNDPTNLKYQHFMAAAAAAGVEH